MTNRVQLKTHLQASAEVGHLVFTRCEKTEEDETVFNVAGVIGDDWDGLSAQQMVPEIQATRTGNIRLRMNTPGGFVNDALDIHNALISFPGKVIVDIVAEAWSAGTIMSAAGDTTRIALGARFGVHRSWNGSFILGNAEEMRSQIKQAMANIEMLEALDLEIAEVLAKRSGKSVKEVHDLMIGPDGVDGTEFVGRAAVDAGFADELIPPKDKTASRAELHRKRLQQASINIASAQLNGRAGLHWTETLTK